MDDAKEIERKVRRQRERLLDGLAAEMQSLERMNPRTQLASIVVRAIATGYDGSTRDYSLATFLGMVCVDAALMEYGDLGLVDRVEVRVV